MIINGNSLEVLKRLDANSIQVCITSPPYLGKRNYGTVPIIWGGDPTCEHDWKEVHPPGYRGSDTNPGPMQHAGNINREGLTSATCKKCGAWRGELGLEPTPELYIEHLVEIFREVWRVLRPDGLLWVNIGDSHWGSGKHPELKPKDIIEIPSMLAAALRKDGWCLRSRLPWLKRNSMPDSTDDRPGSSIEYVFFISKSTDTTFWTHPTNICVRKKPAPDYLWEDRTTGNTLSEEPFEWKTQLLLGSDGNLVYEKSGRPKKRYKRFNLWDGHDYFYDLVAVLQNSSESYNNDRRPRGILRQRVNKNTKYDRDDPQFRKQDEVGSQRYTGFNERYAQKVAESGMLPTRNLRDSDFFFKTWQGLLHNEDGEPMALVVNPRSYKGAHFASFPLSLVEPMIVASTSEKGCCPHCGAPWVRQIKTVPYIYRPTTGSGNQKTDQNPEAAVGLDGTGGHVAVDYETVGWVPSCTCENNIPEPCMVLDPFGGSGATGAAAKNLGRNSIIIELKEEYCKLAEVRVKEGK